MSMFVIFSVIYILIAAAMIVLILLQRGQGASAGASFGGGSSGAMFGSTGSATFLSRTTSGLAVVFFLLSLGMGIYLAHTGGPKPVSDLGVMSGITTPAAPAPATANGKSATSAVQPATEVPSAPSQAQTGTPAGAVPGANNAVNSEVPAATQAAGAGTQQPATGTDTGKSTPKSKN